MCFRELKALPRFVLHHFFFLLNSKLQVALLFGATLCAEYSVLSHRVY